MTARHDLERRVADFYATEAPRRAPDRVLEHALTSVDHTRQRRELGLVPWRSRPMNIYLKTAAAAVVVVALAALGLSFLPRDPGGSAGGIPSPSTPATVSPTPSVSPPPSPTPALTPAPPTSTYTSEIHGLSIGHPADWTVIPATENDAMIDAVFASPGNDFIHDPVLQDHLFLVLGSRALDGQAGEAWAAAAIQEDPDCNAAGESITVDGAPGLLCGQLAVTWAGDHGYSVRLYTSGDEPWLEVAYDRAWFEDVLATVQLPQEDAAPSPSG